MSYSELQWTVLLMWYILKVLHSMQYSFLYELSGADHFTMYFYKDLKGTEKLPN